MKSPLLPAENETAQTCGRVSVLSNAPSNGSEVTSEKSRTNSPELVELTLTEMFISDEKINRMENILDTWSNNLKLNVLTELRKWKLAFMEQQKVQMMKERQKHASQTAGLKSELGNLKELLQTYETSNLRKDEVIANLSQVLDRQKEKLEKMRAFTHWRLQHAAIKEEAFAAQAAQQHYNQQLKKKVWLGWHSLIQKHWKDKVEQACRLRAEEVCMQLSKEYEAKLAEQNKALAKAQAEIQRLQVDRERCEESIKKAFMRGVCALNMEALSIFHSTEGRADQPPADPSAPPGETVFSTTSQLQPRPSTSGSTRFSPVHFEHQEPAHTEADEVEGTSTHRSREQVFPPTSTLHGYFPLGGQTSPYKQVSGRTVTTSQPKSSKTVTARITARAEGGKSARSSIQVMGVAPPMSSVFVERHHPVTQLTVGQATAVKFPYSSQPKKPSTRGRGTAKTQSGSCQVHSIKVVE
ncbi:centrosomal protein POC5 isoform X2 [Gouania willdenowi]|nr:centrosomal protein POC5 isoform X2 [Gouania willdenowi]